MTETNSPAPPAIPRPLFVFSMLYGGMAVIAGVLAFKQVAFGQLAVEAGIFAFLLLVVLSSAIAQLYGRKTADRLVLWGFLPLAVSIGLIALVLSLPVSKDMPAENLAAFELVLSSTPRIMAAGPVAYGVSLLLNVWIFDALRGKNASGTPSGLWMMLRGGIASALSQAVDSVIFITLAFYGSFPIMDLMLGQVLAKVVLSFIVVPPLIALVVWLARRMD